MRNGSKFERGSAVYKCNCCGHNTRATGRGDNEFVKLCADCYDLAGEENSLSDSGEFYESPKFILEMIDRIVKRGADASAWDQIKAKAEALVGVAA